VSTFGLPEPPPLLPPESSAFQSPPAVPESPEPPVSRREHSKAVRAAAGGAIAVLVAGGIAAAVLTFSFLRGSADSMVSFAPSDTSVYVNVDLGPSGGQQLALNGILGKFPGLGGSSRDATINHWLDGALQSSGLSHADVRSWLGSQLSLIVLGSTGNATPAEVSLVASTNDTAAQAMFAKYKSGPLGHAQRWTTATYDGVTVNAGQDPSGATQVWAITGGTVMAGTSEAAIDEVIDTSQGKHASLASTADYTAVQEQIPNDRVVFVYLNVPSLASLVPSGAGTASVTSVLKGYGGIGEAVVASSSGITVSGTIDFDAAKLSAAARAMLGVPAHANGSLAYVPAHALGFLTLVGLPQILRSVVSLAGPSIGTSASQALQQLGITGSSGIINHLTGDAGVEVEQVQGTQVPSGALLIGTNSSGAAQSFLDGLTSAACSAANACGSSRVTRQTYQGVTISTITIPNVNAAELGPSYAVDDGWAIVASTAAEVRAVVDAKRSGNITISPQYRVVAGQIGASNDGMFYLNVQAIVAAVRTVLPADARVIFDQQVAPYLKPIQAIGSSAQFFKDHVATSEFVLIR
jgi:Protein of unknown function (DUF3352)